MEVGLDEGDDVALLELREGSELQLGDVGWGWGGGGFGRCAGAARVRDSCGSDVGRVVLGELEASREKGLADGVAVFGRDEDEVGVVGGDEKDGDAGHC